MKAFQFETLTDLDYKFTKKLALAHKDELDVRSGVVQFHDVALSAETLDFDLDLKDVWLTHKRWKQLTRQYINAESLEVWLAQIEKHMSKKNGKGQAFMRSQTVTPHRFREGKAQARRWGSCIIGFSFRASPKPTLTLHSRASLVGYIGRLDLALAHHIGRLIAARVGWLEVEDISFVWFLDSAQLHNYRALSWWFQDPNLLEVSPGGRPGIKGAQATYRKFLEYNEEGFLYGDHSFGVYASSRRRMNTEVYGYDYALQFEGGTRLGKSAAHAHKPLPSVPLDDLDLSALGGGVPDESDPVHDGSDD